MNFSSPILIGFWFRLK